MLDCSAVHPNFRVTVTSAVNDNVRLYSLIIPRRISGGKHAITTAVNVIFVVKLAQL